MAGELPRSLGGYRNQAVEILCDQDRVRLIAELLAERDRLKAEVIGLQAVAKAMGMESKSAPHDLISIHAPEAL